MNVSNTNEKTTVETRSSSTPGLVLVGRGFLPIFQQTKRRQHLVHEGMHQQKRRKNTDSCWPFGASSDAP